MTRLPRAIAVLGAVVSAAAALAVVVALWRHLEVRRMLDGQGTGYGLPELVVAAAGGGAVVVCVLAVVRARSSSSRLLLAGPVLLGLLAVEATTGGVEAFTVYDASYVPLSTAYSSQLTLQLDGQPLRDAALLVVALVAGGLLAWSVLRTARAA